MVRIITLQLGILCLLCLYSVAFSQEQKLINLWTRGKTTAEVFQSIGAQTGLQFFYYKSQLDLIPNPGYVFTNASIKDVLDVLLKDTDITYDIVSNHIVLKSIEKPIVNLQGIVVDDSDEPLVGAYIKVKGKDLGTLTDSAGWFTLQLPKRSVVVVSFTGFSDKEIIAVKNHQTLKIKLEYEKGSLNEVVVVGYGTQQRKNITGSISSLSGKEIQAMPVTSFQSAIQGRVAGVQVVNNSGNPGGEVYVRIRGNASLMGENKPLYILDGMPVLSGHYFERSLSLSGGQDISILSDINPADIASIEFLKDASATAIYGSRGANGVVLITTKKSTGGKLALTYNTYTGIQRNTKRYRLLNADQYAEYAAEAMRNGGSTGTPPLSATGINTDWQKEIFRNAPITSHLLSLSKGDSITRIYLSAAYFDQSGTIIKNNYKRGNLKLNIEHSIGKCKFGINALGAASLNRKVFDGASSYAVMSNALRRNPSLSVRDTNGNYSNDPGGIENPLRSANDIDYNIHEKRIIGSVYGQYAINKNIKIKSSLSSDYINVLEAVNLPPTLQSSRSRNVFFDSRAHENLWINENTISYDRRIDSHFLSILGGVAHQQSRYKLLLARWSSINHNGTVSSSYDSTLADIFWKMSSLFVKINYNFKDKYLFNVNSRLDRTSRLGGNTGDIFPSLALGWRISKEEFFKNVPLFTEVKLRASHGASGNQDAVRTYNRKGQIINNFNNPGDLDPRLPDANLKWERLIQSDGGIDISLFKNRLSVSADVYIKRSNNLLTRQYLTLDSQVVAVARNLGSIHTSGIEFSINTINTTGRLRWKTNFNISFLKNRVIAYDKGDVNGGVGSASLEGQTIHYTGGPAGASFNIFMPGEDYGSFYGYVYEGADPATGKPLYADLNGDGIITESDRRTIGSPLPKHFGGVANNFSYGPLELDVFIQWSYGNKIFNMTRQVLNNPITASRANASEEQLQRWKNPGDITNVPMATTTSDPFLASSRWVEDGSYLRLKKITLSYHGDPSIFKKQFIKAFTIYVTAGNIFTITNYSGLDPESQNQFTKDGQLGIDLFVQPTPRTFVFGFNVGF
ncbi:MAG TPA: TonB-dependent receptor [Cytophagaceae bacterium]|jgi:TonB-linked SusC/RagA family outer membrane protein